jgi:uncharacterized membrane protein YhhN
MGKLDRIDLALLALSAMLALTYGASGLSQTGIERTDEAFWPALKASGIVLLATMALKRRAHLLAAALAFGALGDALLAMQDETAFLAGAGAFMVGHLFYIALFVRAGIGPRRALSVPWRAFAMVALGAAAIIATAWLVPTRHALFAPLSVYTAVLTLMAASAFTLAPAYWRVMLGGVLFFISDGFVAASLFMPLADQAMSDLRGLTGWMIYWGAQACLCVGALDLTPVRPRAAP